MTDGEKTLAEYAEDLAAANDQLQQSTESFAAIRGVCQRLREVQGTEQQLTGLGQMTYTVLDEEGQAKCRTTVDLDVQPPAVQQLFGKCIESMMGMAGAALQDAWHRINATNKAAQDILQAAHKVQVTQHNPPAV